MRPTLLLADAAKILLHDLAMTGQSRPNGTRTSRASVLRLDGEVAGCLRFCPDPAAGPTRRYDDAAGIRDERVAQLDLYADDRMKPGRLRRRHEADGAVEPAVVGDREAAQPQLDCPLDQLIGCRRPVEEREVGMTVEYGVGGRGHGECSGSDAEIGGFTV